MKKLLVALLVLCTLSLSAFGISAKAQTTTGLAISPPLFELSANPGDQLKNSIRVDNLTDAPMHLTAVAKNFTALGEEGQVDLQEGDSGSFTLAPWITITPNQFTVPPKESKVFSYAVDVPANAEPGGHFGSIIFKTDAKPVDEGTGAAVSQEIGALLLVKVAGDIREEARVESFNSTHTIWENGPVGFSARVKNTGNVHFKPRGTVSIASVFGDEVGNVPISQNNILPDTIRNLSAEWKPGRFTVGRFTATLTVAYGADNTILTSTTTFWIIPYRFIIISLAMLGLIGWVVWRSRKRLKAAYKALKGK